MSVVKIAGLNPQPVDYGIILGCTYTRPEMVVAWKLKITGCEIIKTMYQHPVMREAVLEALVQEYNEVIY